MNYQRVYDNLIAKYGSWKKPEGIYTERHRKIPGCMGGKYVKSNAFYMSARAHYLCHLILARLYGGKLSTASYLMSGLNGRQSSKMYETNVLIASRLEVSSEERKRRSESACNQWTTSSLRDVVSTYMKNRTVSKETKAKISASKSGVKLSDEHRKRISEAGKGKVISIEAVEKTRKANTGLKRSSEARARISEGVKRAATPEVRQRASIRNKGKVLSEETKRKISESLKATLRSINSKGM